MSISRSPLPAHIARQIAVVADVCPDTVQSLVAGQVPVRPMARRRIERAIAALKLGPLVAAAKGLR